MCHRRSCVSSSQFARSLSLSCCLAHAARYASSSPALSHMRGMFLSAIGLDHRTLLCWSKADAARACFTAWRARTHFESCAVFCCLRALHRPPHQPTTPSRNLRPPTRDASTHGVATSTLCLCVTVRGLCVASLARMCGVQRTLVLSICSCYQFIFFQLRACVSVPCTSDSDLSS
jgi:hypothetical protein